jgi:hypothetical protein
VHDCLLESHSHLAIEMIELDNVVRVGCLSGSHKSDVFQKGVAVSKNTCVRADEAGV